MRSLQSLDGSNQNVLIKGIRENSHTIHSSKDLDPLMDYIGDSKYVLLGEASHGTHEYYTWRTAISKRLIEEKGFSFIGVEGDWPDCYRLNRYIKNYDDTGENAFEVLHQFNRWPTWMWANWEVNELAEWMKNYNAGFSVDKKIGFYGLDVYSLGESIEAILEYLKKHDPESYKTAKGAAECFEPYGYEGVDYARSTQFVPDTCEDEVIELLSEIRNKISGYNTDREMVFSTEQNALIAKNAEHYYRKMVMGRSESWNVRDRHMVQTLDRLMDFHGPDAKAIVWEHNTHIGSASATDMKNRGMINVGELVTENHSEEGVVKVGFGSYKGSVIAGRGWGNQMRKMKVPEAREGSWEYLVHRAGAENKIMFTESWKDNPLFQNPIGHRAIGVVYHPEQEHLGNYVPTIIPDRYEVFIHIDETEALHPLHIKPSGHQTPETYPWGV